jgi:hypothetical protein
MGSIPQTGSISACCTWKRSVWNFIKDVAMDKAQGAFIYIYIATWRTITSKLTYDVLFSDTEMDELNNGSTILDGRMNWARMDWICNNVPACTRCVPHRIRTLFNKCKQVQAIVLQYCSTEQQCHASELHAHRVYYARSEMCLVYTAIGESVGRYSTKHSLRGISAAAPRPWQQSQWLVSS